MFTFQVIMLFCDKAKEKYSYRFYHIELVRCMIQQSVKCISFCYEKKVFQGYTYIKE